MRRRTVLGGLAGLVFAPHVWAQGTTWPNRPIRLVVGFAAGGATDIVARMIARAMQEQLGQSVVVENRPGAGSNIAADAVAHAEPDGHTLLVATPAALTFNPNIYAKLPFNAEKDFVPVSLICSILDVLTVPPSKPWKSLGELLADARARPGAISFASSGVGSGSHVALVLLQALTGINVLHVPYKGGGALISDFLAGRVDASIGTGPVLVPLVKSDRMRALGVATEKRSPLLADVPAIGEVVPNYKVDNWIGLMAPGGTPSAVVEKLYAAVQRGLADASLRDRLAEQAAAPSLMGPPEFDAFLKREMARWAPVLKALDLKIE